MSEELTTAELIARLRQGDQQAASAFVARYEPEVRRYVRFRLTDPHLRRFLDSLDICQSVLANFFLRLSTGELALESPEQLAKLLAVMVRNKVCDVARRAYSQRRGGDRARGDAAATLDFLPAAGDTPSDIVAGRELLEAFRARLTPEERTLWERRLAGSDWEHLAAEMGVAAEALRKRLSRAIDRTARELGLIEVDDG